MGLLDGIATHTWPKPPVPSVICRPSGPVRNLTSASLTTASVNSGGSCASSCAAWPAVSAAASAASCASASVDASPRTAAVLQTPLPLDFLVTPLLLGSLGSRGSADGAAARPAALPWDAFSCPAGLKPAQLLLTLDLDAGAAANALRGGLPRWRGVVRAAVGEPTMATSTVAPSTPLKERLAAGTARPAAACRLRRRRRHSANAPARITAAAAAPTATPATAPELKPPPAAPAAGLARAAAAGCAGLGLAWSGGSGAASGRGTPFLTYRDWPGFQLTRLQAWRGTCGQNEHDGSRPAWPAGQRSRTTFMLRGVDATRGPGNRQARRRCTPLPNHACPHLLSPVSDHTQQG